MHFLLLSLDVHCNVILKQFITFCQRFSTVAVDCTPNLVPRVCLFAGYVVAQPNPRTGILWERDCCTPGKDNTSEQVGNLSEHARRKSIWRHILGVFSGFIWF